MWKKNLEDGIVQAAQRGAESRGETAAESGGHGQGKVKRAAIYLNERDGTARDTAD